MRQQLYRYTVIATDLIDTPTGKLECNTPAKDLNDKVIWYHTPEEALEMSVRLEHTAAKSGSDLTYSVSVNYWSEPHTGMGHY